MRYAAPFAILLLTLLSACAQSDYLVAAALREEPEREAVEAQLSLERHYTHHAATIGVASEIVRLHVDDAFSSYERAKILRAVNEWNHVLNGFVRLDLVSSPSIPSVWEVMPAHGGPPKRNRENVLAITMPLPSGGGLVLVIVDVLEGRDLGSVMRHELGHVMGLGHDPKGHLMAPHYSDRDQQCVDKAASDAIAVARRLPAAALNWCNG
jgi:hypothetical protein